MSSSARIVGVVDGRDFDGGFPQAPTAGPELRDDRLLILSRLFTEHLKEDSPANREVQRLILKRAELNKECDVFVQAQVEPIREKIVQQHEDVKARAREQQGKISELRATIAEAGRDLNTKRDVQARAASVLHASQQRRKELSRFSSRVKFIEADGAIDAALKVVEKANQAEAEAMQRLNQLRLVAMKPLVEELDRIAAEEQRLAAIVTGEGYTDSLGLVHPAGEPL